MPEWQTGYDLNGAGGLISAILAPVGGFGQFLLVLLALSVIGSLVRIEYTIWCIRIETFVIGTKLVQLLL
jgi:fumarate reductase subunit D